VTDEYRTLKLICQGDIITVSYDGEELISATDKDYRKGTIALSVQDKVVYYIKVTGPQIPNTKLSPVNPTGKLNATWGEIKKEIAQKSG